MTLRKTQRRRLPGRGISPAGLLLLGTALVSVSCRTTAVRQVSDPQPAIARLQAGGGLQAEVDELVQPLVASGEMYGVAVGVVLPDGTTQTFGYGRTGRRGEAAPPGPDSIFQVASVSKIFLGALLARLVQEGQLSYQDTVRDILPPQIPVSPEAGRITLYQLATHQSGFPREPATFRQMCVFIGYMFTGNNLYGYITRPYVYRYLRHAHPKAPDPGEFAYSNFAIGLLAHLIEVKMGRPVGDLIVEKVCRPLGLRDSVFALNSEQQRRLTMGHIGNQACYRPPNWPRGPWDMGEIMSASAGMYSSVNDLLRFAKANLGLLHRPVEPWLAETHRLRLENREQGVGLGWVVNRLEGGRRTIHFKQGIVAGYSSYLGLDLEARVAVVVLANTFDWDEKIGHNLVLRLSGAVAGPQSQLARTAPAPGVENSDRSKPPPERAAQEPAPAGH